MSRAPAADYTLQIIEFFAQANSDVGIADISNFLGINKNAVSRVLEALTEGNWIYMSDAVSKKYRLTMRPFSLMSASVRADETVKIAEPILSKIHKQLGDSIYFGVRKDNKVLYLLHYDSVSDVRISGRVGGEYPLHCSAPGKVLLANESPAEVEAYFSAATEKRTANTIQTAVEFYEECQKIKKTGYAIDNEEFGKGIICIACPVYNSSGEVVATIGLSSLTIYDDINSLIENKYPILRHAAMQISAALGYKIL